LAEQTPLLQMAHFGHSGKIANLYHDCRVDADGIGRTPRPDPAQGGLTAGDLLLGR
jgi:hypothetical protein